MVRTIHIAANYINPNLRNDLKELYPDASMDIRVDRHEPNVWVSITGFGRDTDRIQAGIFDRVVEGR